MINKMINWAKRYRILSIGLGFFTPLIIIHILFLVPAPFSFLVAQWEAGEVIAYCAGFMAFGGTVFLGMTANGQNAR